MAAQDECPPLPPEKAGRQVSRYHVTKWERRDVASCLLRSTMFSAIMLAPLFAVGDLQGQPIHWCLLIVCAFVLDARFTDRNVQYRLSLAKPDEVCPSSEEYHVSPAPEDDKP